MSKEQHISNNINALFKTLPVSMQKKLSTQSYIKHVHNQFKEVVNENLLRHVNSVYLIPDNQALSVISQIDTNTNSTYTNTPKKLIIYVDNSICAAEFNARRELFVLKYRELFNVIISVFEIRISKGNYKNSHPFILEECSKEATKYILTHQDYEKIERMISNIKQPKLKESFRKALIAQKEKNGNLQKK